MPTRWLCVSSAAATSPSLRTEPTFPVSAVATQQLHAAYVKIATYDRLSSQNHPVRLFESRFSLTLAHSLHYHIGLLRQPLNTALTREEIVMLNLAVTFLIIAIIAGLLGFSGIAGASANIAWILFVIGLVLALVFFLTGRRPR